MKDLRHSALKQFGFALLGAILWFGTWVVIAHLGDCKPSEVDGQCGLSGFAGTIFGITGAVVILVVSGIAIAVVTSRRADEPY